MTVFDGCIETIRQAPLLEFCSIELYWMRLFSSILKMTVRHMRLQRLELLQSPFELLCGFLDVLELLSLEAYHHQASHRDIAVDNVISLLYRSGTYLKQLALDVHLPRMEDIKKLLNAVPCLQNLRLNFCCFIGDGFVIHKLFKDLSYQNRWWRPPPVLVGNTAGLLPVLQSLTIFARGRFMWGVSSIYSADHTGNSYTWTSTK